MTKARARQRAKAKSGQKIKKREDSTDASGQKARPGKFDPGALSIKGPNINASAGNFGGAKRGAARSK